MIDFNYGVELGPLDSELIGQIRHWRNNPRIMRWCRQSDLISDVEQEDWFEKQASDPTIKMYGIFKDCALMGVAGFTSIDRLNRRAEFSLYIKPQAHGQGLGSAGLKTLLKHGFKNLNLNLIWGESLDGNPAIELFKKLGMQIEGRRRQFYFKDGVMWDAHLFSITAAEFNL